MKLEEQKDDKEYKHVAQYVAPYFDESKDKEKQAGLLEQLRYKWYYKHKGGVMRKIVQVYNRYFR